MPFEWDATKNEINIAHHKIDFADVPLIFNGPMLTDLDERIAHTSHGGGRLDRTRS